MFFKTQNYAIKITTLYKLSSKLHKQNMYRNRVWLQRGLFLGFIGLSKAEYAERFQASECQFFQVAMADKGSAHSDFVFTSLDKYIQYIIYEGLIDRIKFVGLGLPGALRCS